MKISKKFLLFIYYLYLSIANHIVNKIPIFFVRKFIYKWFYFMKIGRKTNLHMGIRIFAPWKIEIGDNTVINYNVTLDGRRGLKIGNNVDIAGNVQIFTLGHDINSPDYSTKGGLVVIEDYCSLYTSSSVLPGCIIKKGSVVAFGAVVTKSTEEYSVVAGIPAHKTGERNHLLTYKLNYKRYFH